MRQREALGGFNLRHLRYFLAVCETGSFRRASSVLNIAQSAVSRRVADLETALRVTLLERNPRGVTPTGAGIALMASAGRILGEIETARAELDRNASGEAGILHIGLFGTTSRLGFLPELISRCRSQEAAIRLELSPVTHGQIDEAALAKVELAFYEGPQPANGHAAARCLYAGHYLLALPRGHRLALAGRIALSDLADQELIVFPRLANPLAHDRLIGEAAQRGFALNIIHETESECSRLAFAAAGMGIALCSPLAVSHDQQFEVDYRPIADFVLPFELWLSRHDLASPAADRFGQVAEQVLAEIPTLNRLPI